MIAMRSGLALALALAFVLGSVVCAQAQSTKIGEAAIAVGRIVEEPQHEKLLEVMAETERTPVPFETDGCSGGMSASWAPLASVLPRLAEQYQKAPPWESCCITHDRAYHSAQNATTVDESFEARLLADETLMQCVLMDGEDRRADIVAEFSTRPEIVDKAYSVVASGMFNAVRVGGAPCSGLPWRWGYGYPTCFWK